MRDTRAGTGPVARAIRILNVHLETEHLQGGRPGWQVEGVYQPGREVVYVPWSQLRDEHCVLAGQPNGSWTVNGEIYEYLDLSEGPQEWLAKLL